jgi:hypothetical protein
MPSRHAEPAEVNADPCEEVEVGQGVSQKGARDLAAGAAEV